ncbi:hypothetical protein [Chitinophaga lutea]|uniref:hypothetical protein n=1 Tax=Chitinophaga lutea TaxID=2488634 RepID=UPI000F4F9C83|nr:hypothetical protein [Chitinophaga lutea]
MGKEGEDISGPFDSGAKRLNGGRVENAVLSAVNLHSNALLPVDRYERPVFNFKAFIKWPDRHDNSKLRLFREIYQLSGAVVIN